MIIIFINDAVFSGVTLCWLLVNVMQVAYKTKRIDYVIS